MNGDGTLLTILTFDSYYLCLTGRAQLLEKKIPFVASVTKERFGRLVDKVKEKVGKPGQFAGIFRPESSETFMYMWDSDKAVGKKFALSNAFKRSPGKLAKGSVPVYDHYKSMFNACDRYNRMLHDRKWPHKNGGRNIPGDEGHHHNFAMSCILQNTFNAYIEINSINPVEYEFKKYCVILSDKLFEHADIIDCA